MTESAINGISKQFAWACPGNGMSLGMADRLMAELAKGGKTLILVPDVHSLTKHKVLNSKQQTGK